MLSRFLGAVFLVLLAGLLLLDRALLGTNSNQAKFDAQTGALLTESFLTTQGMLLDRISSVVFADSSSLGESVSRELVRKLVNDTRGLTRLRAIDAQGKVFLDATKAGARDTLQTDVLPRFLSGKSGDGLVMAIVPVTKRRAYIVLNKNAFDAQHRLRGSVSLVFDGEALRFWLDRTTPDTRLTLAVVSGVDTIVLLGHSDREGQALVTAERIVRLETGGTWRVVTTHALTTRLLRLSLWIVGVFGVMLLGFGLLREKRQALRVADRSIELERLYRDVKRANQAKSEFLANVSHELRTPLNAIVGFVELLRDGFYGDLSPRQVLPVDRIAASATHLRHLVDQVLDIAKIAAGRLEIHPESIVLRPFVLNIASELESLVSEKDINFSIAVGSSLPRVRTDPTHLRQILINLIGNAVKYTAVGTVSVRARILGMPVASNFRRTSAATADEALAKALLAHAPRNGIWIALQVVDTGVGILPMDTERIFEEFEQVNAGPRSDSMQRGTGLGLAISRRLARLLGGEISVESELGRGSTFTVWLPVNPSDVKRESVPAPATNSDVSSA